MNGVATMRKGNLIVAGLAAAVAACGGSSSVQDPAPDAGQPPAIVRVENQTYADFNIFAHRNETKQRLGRSTANTTQSFRIPASLLSGEARIRISAEPIGTQISGTWQEVSVQPGDSVMLVIPAGGR